jgi:hypothetical protein
MTMLYHATPVELSIGRRQANASELIGITDVTRRDAEMLLEARRPEGRPHRFSSWFACDEPAFAAEYLESEIQHGRYKGARTDRPFLYAVEMAVSSKQPMVLVNAVAVELAGGRTETAMFLADEYWSPKQEWRFWEYTGREITIVAEVPWPDGLALAGPVNAYMRDSEELKHLLSRLHI